MIEHRDVAEAHRPVEGMRGGHEVGGLQPQDLVALGDLTRLLAINVGARVTTSATGVTTSVSTLIVSRRLILIHGGRSDFGRGPAEAIGGKRSHLLGRDPATGSLDLGAV